MRRPTIRFRFSVRRLLIATAMVGVLVGLGVEGERSRQRYLLLARHHARARDELHKFWMIVPPSGSVEFFGDRKSISAQVGYHGRLKQKYEQAAHFPWLPVEPDPPRPE